MKRNTNLPKNKGKVFLVGAGPGAAGLLTLRGASLLQEADAVVYDGLVGPAVLDFALKAEKIYAGKYKVAGKKHCIDQKKINQLLVKLARAGKKTIRLKGGDPFVFGRGGEEATFLKKSGIDFEIVPGISAGIAAPAYAGIPVTDRRFASSVTFVTAHEEPGKEDSADWKYLAKISGTLVIFMGVRNLEKIIHALIRHGKSAATLASVVEWGTLPQQKVVSGSLKEIITKTKKAGLQSPAVTVIGQVNRLRQKLNWLEKQPLAGKTVLITRASHQAKILETMLREKGAQIIECPVIEIKPPLDWDPVDQAVENFSEYDWVVFTSVNGVEFFFDHLKHLRKDARIFSGKKIAVIGEATADVLSRYGLRADLIPSDFTSEGLVRAFRKNFIHGKTFLLARTDIAPPYLKEELKKLGARVQDLTVYRTVPVQENHRKKELEKLLLARKIDFITFTSASTVKHFFEQFAPAFRKKITSKLISIGPVTSATIEDYGFRPYREAKVHHLEGLVKAITE